MSEIPRLADLIASGWREEDIEIHDVPTIAKSMPRQDQILFYVGKFLAYKGNNDAQLAQMSLLQDILICSLPGVLENEGLHDEMQKVRCYKYVGDVLSWLLPMLEIYQKHVTSR